MTKKEIYELWIFGISAPVCSKIWFGPTAHFTFYRLTFHQTDVSQFERVGRRVGGALWLEIEIAFVACDTSQNHKSLSCSVAAVPPKSSICEDAREAFFHNCFWPSCSCCCSATPGRWNSSTSSSTSRTAGGNCHLKTPPSFDFQL